jgi:enoyl-CoA hydratase/carnithine racemase
VSTLSAERVGAALVLTMSRVAKRNAIGREQAHELADVLEHLEADVRGVVLASGHEEVFVSGGDLDEIAALLELGPEGADAIASVGGVLTAIEAAPVPVVAAVAGEVFGGGCELLLLCDAVFAEERAGLSFRHARMGLSPAWGGAPRLLQRVGPLAARDLLFTGRRVSARECAALGLVTELADEARARALEFVESVAGHDRAVIAAQKRLLQELERAARGGDAAAELERSTLRQLFGVGENARVLVGHRARRARTDPGER